MNELQQRYKEVYTRISELRQQGLDVDGNSEIVGLRLTLASLWNFLTREERAPFLAPACNARGEGHATRKGQPPAPRKVWARDRKPKHQSIAE